MITRIFFLFSLFTFGNLSWSSPIKVVATTSDFGALAREIGGEAIIVSVLVPPKSDPHFMDPKPSLVIKLKKSDMLITGGAGLEDAWLVPLLKKSRNNKIKIGGESFFKASNHVELLEKPSELDRAHGDVHAEGNPHFLFHPNNALRVGEALLNSLIHLKPDKTEYFKGNFIKFKVGIEKIIKTFPSKVLSKQSILTFHKSYEYIADYLGFSIVGYLEPKPGIPPSPKHLKGLIPVIKSSFVKMIYLEPFQRDNSAKFLQKKSQVSYKYLQIYPSKTSNSFSGFLFEIYKSVTIDLGKTK